MSTPTAYGPITSYAALDNTNLISEAQWSKLAKLSLRCGLNVEELLRGYRIELVDPSRVDDIRLLGPIPCSPSYRLYGCIDTDGSTHT